MLLADGGGRTTTTARVSAPPPPPPVATPQAAARTVIAANTTRGNVNTAALAGHVVAAEKVAPQQARAAFTAIHSELARTNAGDAARFAQDVRRELDRDTFPGMAVFGAGQGFVRAGAHFDARGGKILTDNPILTVEWVPLKSAWTGRGGFNDPLNTKLTEGGIIVGQYTGLVPPGSVGKGSGLSTGKANNINGAAGEQHVADRYSGLGWDVSTSSSANKRPEGRVPDVVATKPNDDNPRYAESVEVEVKVGEKKNNGRELTQADRDIRRLESNRATREAGEALVTQGRVLSTTGKVLRPVGMAMDTYDVVQSIRADGGVGKETGRTLSGIAGGAAGAWGGAAAGAAIGSVVPVVGTAAGAIVGGIIGGIGGDAIGKAVFGWFD